ncbi:helix-turn-helix domain-containing protein [Vallitalea okinawensis]|uniref:helix-turn-helix domain-containing protein n=1 Tax=Vallitalea okinawensis TaxID=2078660 RepID=UPI000CFC8710|nr:AraC family transcriptional regulator [Vallitalea okinawensis]
MPKNYYKELNTIVIYIESNLKDKISYTHFAQAVGFSIPHIREIFKARFKKPLARYILERKVSHIAYELSKSDNTLTTLALEYGFETYEVFIRAFKRITGMTPSKFRKSSCFAAIGYISSGVYGPLIYYKIMEDDEKMPAMKNRFSDCVLSSVPAVNFGGGVRSTFPACLQTCLEYLGQDIDYDYLMTVSGTAFRLRWNTECIDGGNIGILNIFDDPYKPFNLCFKACGRTYNILKKEDNMTKEDFIQFIMKEIQEGKPCIALGIVGPPEACVITGYRDNGEKLLGYSLFQNDPSFCANTIIEDSGYFACSDWWQNGENGDIKPVFSIGQYKDYTIDIHEIIRQAIGVMGDRNIKQYASGQNAYSEVINFILDDDKWLNSKLDATLFEQVVVYGDAMVMLCNRASAATFFTNYSTPNSQLKELLNQISKKLKQIAELPEKMCNVPPMGWNMSREMIDCICKSEIRKKIANYFLEAKKLEGEIIDLFTEALALDI